MKKRILPPPDKFASCPSEGRVLDYYKSHFESVYVLLSPFMRPSSIPFDRFNPETWPAKQELIEGVTPVSWKDILEATNLNGFDEIDIALRTSILGLNKKFEDKRLSVLLSEYTEEKEIVHPQEGVLSPLLENKLYESLQRIGQEWLWVGDEFGKERKLFWIDDLKQCDEIPAHGCIFTPDKTVLVTTHWDSHFSFLCSSNSIIERILGHCEFEGFYCSPETEVYWSVRGS